MRYLLLLLLCTPAAHAVEKMTIGTSGIPWTAIVEGSSKLSVERDSIWTWDAQAGDNLAARALERNGRIFSTFESTSAFGPNLLNFVSNADMAKTIDGDDNTAFNPDEIGLARRSSLYIDLGGHFGVQQIRFFPRLDTDHRDLFLQAFALGSDRKDPAALTAPDLIAIEPFGSPFLINANQNSPNTQSIVIWPLPNQPRDDKEMRHVRIETLNERPWEIAEIEIIANGTVAPVEYVSLPLTVPGGFPVWGILRVNGGSPDDLPIIVQTRTGPDPNPVQYFLRLTKSQTLREVTKQGWENIVTLSAVERGEAEQGPVVPNPEWSAWEAVTDGLIISPSPKEYIQFRVLWNEPGVKIETMEFEYTSLPLAQVMEAEISPVIADAGQETEFVLSLQVQQIDDSNVPTSGFRELRVQTAAEITAIDRVLVKDREVLFKSRINPGNDFTVELWDRIDPKASFIEVYFRGRIFADGTAFRVQALDERSTTTETETIYQFAQAGDVDPRSPGATLAVRLSSRNDPLVDDINSSTRAFTPNADGINDYLLVSYNLLRLTRPAEVFFEIFDIAGKKIQRGFAGADQSGRFARIWDGLDRHGATVAPGIYLYQVKVEADAGTFHRQGIVNVAY
ncbi:MAG: FlgD immunoglobulin-like domain containing protein [Candidatus Latescibacterota bacterium]|jgi:hypothetical protein